MISYVRCVVHLLNSIHLLYCLYSTSIRYAGIIAREKSYYYNIIIADI